MCNHGFARTECPQLAGNRQPQWRRRTSVWRVLTSRDAGVRGRIARASTGQRLHEWRASRRRTGKRYRTASITERLRDRSAALGSAGQSRRRSRTGPSRPHVRFGPGRVDLRQRDVDHRSTAADAVIVGRATFPLWMGSLSGNSPGECRGTDGAGKKSQTRPRPLSYQIRTSKW
jgi:hypothetical protein